MNVSTVPSSPRVVVVLGATGQQGGGVVRALLEAGSWIVKAGTSDPSSVRAQQLLSKHQTQDHRLELVAADVYDMQTLLTAFAGAYGVFGITSERHPHKEIADEESMRHEIDAGRNIVQAAKDCRIQHFIFSSLPNMEKATSGQFSKIFHMDNKHAVEMIARDALPGQCTFLVPGFFYTNLRWRQYSRPQEDGTVRFCCPLPQDQVAQWTDPEYDIGAFAAKAFDLGPQKTGDKTYLVMSPQVTQQDLADRFSKATGKRANHSPTSFEEFGDLTAPFVGPAFKEDAMQMMQRAAIATREKVAYGALDPLYDHSAEDLGLKASTFEQWLERSGWKGPDRM